MATGVWSPWEVAADARGKVTGCLVWNNGDQETLTTQWNYL